LGIIGTVLQARKTMKSKVDDLMREFGHLVHMPEDQNLLARMLNSLDEKYTLSQKIVQETGLEEIIKQLTGRIYQAYGTFAALKGKRILDIACGSNTSKAPSFVFVNTPFGEQQIPISHVEGHTALFEPWFCRILLELGADPVGIDLGNLDGETFEHYKVNLGQPGALNFLAEHSFDAVHDSRLFGSPEFAAQFPNTQDRLKVAVEIWAQEQRLIKAKGIVIHSDAAYLVGNRSDHY
jgi:hypothetical protein